MNIYVGHSTGLDFEKRLYGVLRDSQLDEKHELVLPHENSDELFDSKTYLKNNCDVFIAEVSRPSTGLGIELGWADEYNVSILCIYREVTDVSSSLTAVTKNIESYSGSDELIRIMEDFVNNKVF